MVASGGKIERCLSSVTWGLSETSVILTVIGSLGGTADERLADAHSSTWDSSLALKIDWDEILDDFKRELDQKLNINVRREISWFTWAADGLVLQSLFPVVVFWVTPEHLEDWYVSIVEAAGVSISFFKMGVVDPIVEAGHGG